MYLILLNIREVGQVEKVKLVERPHISYHVQADVGRENFLEVKVRDRKFEVPFIVDLKEDWAEVKIKIFQQNKTSKYLPGGDRP